MSSLVNLNYGSRPGGRLGKAIVSERKRRNRVRLERRNRVRLALLYYKSLEAQLRKPDPRLSLTAITPLGNMMRDI